MFVKAGSALRAARVAAGVSLSAMSARTHYSKALLGHLETGRRTVRPEHVRAYEEALSVRIDLTGRSVDLADVELIRQAVDVVTAIGLRHGGMASVGVASSQWEWARDLLGRLMPAETRSLVSVQAARLVDRLAWSLADTGRSGRAVSVYSDALGLAADDAVTHAAVAVNLANHHTTTGRPDDALTLLDSLGSVVPVVDFTAESARARAFASTGDWGSVVRHIGLADDAHSRVDLSDLPDTHRPFVTGHDAHADNEAGKAFALLAQQGHRKARSRAVERLSLAHARFGPDRARARLKCEERLSALGG
ncbi:helix-turn-helix domain-containing protein [Actinophytocola sp. NPDC049390]|uniref:helix-turn-helix domain-containing protein n=1 Tax=Actinophytocola sp. NPDC049390 TaxID=3363894 RepID=UPI0037B0CC7C